MKQRGAQETDVSTIPLLPGAVEFIENLKLKGHQPVIVSDSHPKYVNKIVDHFFKIPALSLADKPNITKTASFIANILKKELKHDNFMLIGDTWLDIELGRALRVPTVLASFYDASSQDVRDGIGQDWKRLKSGATFYVTNYNDIYEIINNPLKNLLAIEAVFQGQSSVKAVRFKTTRYPNRIIIYRSLGRQQNGECDKYAVADKYFEFQREGRSLDTLNKLAMGVANYLKFVIESMPNITWDILTYVSDKATTKPENKMKKLIELVDISINKEKLICWSDDIEGSIRTQKDYSSRREFVNKYMYISSEPSIVDKSIIIIDDQFTTGGTAHSVCGKLIEKGAKNLLFVTLFMLADTVNSERSCPHCGARLQVKIKRSDGSKFLSCVAPEFRGSGCGKFIENIK